MKAVNLTPTQKAIAQQLYLQAQQSQQAFTNYTRGLKDGLGLEGKWGLDVSRWAFVPPSKEKPNVS